MRVKPSSLRKCSLAPAFLLFVITQPACHMLTKPESKSDTAQPAQPGMFTLTPDQLSHLKTTVVGKATWAMAVHTTGTVDWDADHTTQAITQVNGPISRILVDTGRQCQAGRSAALRLQPGRGQRHLAPIARRATARHSTSASWTA